MTKLQGKIGGVNVELDRPEPVEQGGVWYEAVEYRLPNKSDKIIVVECGLFLCRLHRVIIDGEGYATTWIMRPIPTPTPEQLRAIGYKLDGDKPRECKSGDKIWHGDQCVTYYSGFDQMCRWHVKDDPAKATGEREPLKVELMICDHAKECKHSDSCSRKKPHSKKIGCSGTNETQYPSDCKFIGQARCVPYVKAKPPITQAGKNAGHTDCTGCKRAIFNKHYRDMESWMDVCAANQLDEECLDCFDDPRDERKNYTPQPPKGEDAIKDNAQKYWENVYLHCQKLGMQPKTGLTGEQDVCAFIRDLHRDSETYKTHREIWLKECESICDALEDLAELPHHPRPGWKTCINKIKQREWEKKYSILEITFFIRNLYTRKNAETIDYITKMLEHPKYGISALNRRE